MLVVARWLLCGVVGGDCDTSVLLFDSWFVFSVRVCVARCMWLLSSCLFLRMPLDAF